MFLKKYNNKIIYPFSIIVFATCIMMLIGNYFPLYENETYSRIKNTIEVWTQFPIKEHYFLSYTSGLDAPPYASYGYFSSLLFGLYQLAFEYIFSGYGQWSTLWLFVVSYVIVAYKFIFYLGRFTQKEKLVLYFIFLFFGLSQGYLIATFYVQHDNFFPFTGLLISILTINHFKNIYSNQKLIFNNSSLILLALFGHIAGLATILLYSIFLRSYISRFKGLLLIILSLVNIFLPYLLVNHHRGSSFLYRSGLDGDRTYFSNHFQAVFFPYDSDFPRWISILSVIIVMIIFFGILRFKLSNRSILNGAMFFMLSVVGYLSYVSIFPQSVSIHPYLYDFLWIVPLNFSAIYMLSQSQKIAIPDFFSGRVFATIFLIAAFLMMNLIAITTFVNFQ